MLPSLGLRLFLAFLAVAVVAIGIVALSAGRSTSTQFISYLAEEDLVRAQAFQSHLISRYREQEGWENLAEILTSLAAIAGDWLVVTTPQGVVLGDSSGSLLGRTLNQGELGTLFPIVVAGQTVAQLHFLPASGPAMARRMEEMMAAAGHQMEGGMMGPMMQRMMGGMMGQRQGIGAPPPGGSPGVVLSQTRGEDFLGRVRSSLWLAGLGAGLVAILLSLLFSRYITLPLHHLRHGAGRIAAGDFSHRIPVSSQDEIGELAASFNLMAESLSRHQRLRRQLMADIAHELRTPLTVLRGSLEAIQDGVVEATPERVESLRQEVSRLSALVDDLQDLSLAEAGQLKLNMAPVDLLPLLRRSVDSFQAQAVAKGVKLTLETDGAGVVVSGDARRLEQVAANLLSNALRYTPAGGEIKVTVERQGGEVGVGVKDTGIGIPAADLPRVFDRFYRVDKSRSRATGQSGLGLAIVKQLVEMHHGRVWAESEPGRGSRFAFSLPLSG